MRPVRQNWFPALACLVPVMLFAVSRTDYANYVAYTADGDIVSYSRGFSYATRTGFVLYMTSVAHERVFLAMHWLYANLGFSLSDSMLANSMMMIAAYFFYASRQCNNVLLGALSTVAFIMLPWFEQLGQNTLRQGFSLIFILTFFRAVNYQQKRWAVLFAALAIGSHYSAALFVSVYILTDFLPRSGKLFVAVVVLTFVGYVTDYITVLSGMIVTPILLWTGLYTQYSTDAFLTYQVGYKALFFYYSLFQCVVSVLLLHKAEKQSDARLAKYCIVMTVIYMAASGLPYYNRVAMMPMLLLPVVVVTLCSRITLPRWGLRSMLDPGNYPFLRRVG
ncbi:MULTISPECIES: EpsG family protein [unclassified Mesorhizobium]|uniref:EpsG family protein n=1 Tax=unclassified Mesorhizobium TaxID=325217 RepID=UPI000FCBE261|nr:MULTISPECIES: EpsG family protein [unclassified Mesorhizobium]RUU66859.1 hypothetical protein EOC99_04940 [Mesorhizobium sp. M7A.T.Ca.TU.009.01.1.1]RUU82660.1 hypothetical protein EOD03_16175 [Mesorhizobium sp. M7A.T.Ca.TU.009.01.1.2]RUT89751.1 hypothetical protein EOD14_01105 [Mesorhizobium sp. M7A.T.Ca.US.000.02.1.1]RUT90570.1 hypothetical protein EOD15_18315 [Mesorhizobium sp. M7A.T.Ca.US.000.02.2.1]RUU03736.1 hypothetical protein EOD12_09195 [Mesorhizobium sp. M7A.T.Ca.TU.009.02.1.1]